MTQNSDLVTFNLPPIVKVEEEDPCEEQSTEAFIDKLNNEFDIGNFDPRFDGL